MTDQLIPVFITIALQGVIVVAAFIFFYWKESLSKRNILRNKREVNVGMIYDKEIEIEASWILLRQEEAKMDVAKEEIEQNLKAINIEKDKTPMDLEKVKGLVVRNGELGYLGENNDGSPKYGKGSLLSAEGAVEAQRQAITTSVMEREYLKTQLKAIDQLIKEGADFDILEEELKPMVSKQLGIKEEKPEEKDEE
ncbi:MAG TPA: hypothetical protein ENI23_14120 [bacterium]|nr:hypothetical protein [bacterium]